MSQFQSSILIKVRKGILRVRTDEMRSALILRSDNSKFAEYAKNRMIDPTPTGKSKQNFDLSESQFEELLQEMQNGNEILFEQTFLAHFEYAMKYLMNKHKASRDNAYDVVMNVMIEFRNRLLDGKIRYGNLSFMFSQMCTQRYRRQMGHKLDVEDYTYQSSIEETTIDEETFEALDSALEKLGENCQKIIKDVYFNKKSFKDLAKAYDTAAATLRKQKERCITKLKMLLRQKLNTR